MHKQAGFQSFYKAYINFLDKKINIRSITKIAFEDIWPLRHKKSVFRYGCLLVLGISTKLIAAQAFFFPDEPTDFHAVMEYVHVALKHRNSEIDILLVQIFQF